MLSDLWVRRSTSVVSPSSPASEKLRTTLTLALALTPTLPLTHKSDNFINGFVILLLGQHEYDSSD